MTMSRTPEKTQKTISAGELHSKTLPPKVRARVKHEVPARYTKIPSQSICFNLETKGRSGWKSTAGRLHKYPGESTAATTKLM